jgi:Bacteriocin-protection, YdeI or OmpD-Associated/Domain of unknown function (DUF1905)
MRWSEFAARQRVLAGVAHDQLIKPGVVLAGTTRRDGSARISGVEPLIMDGEFWLSMMPASAKARDLHRDPRILVHSIVTSAAPQAEIMMRGTVRAETDPDIQQRYAAAVRAHLGWQPVAGEFALFAVDISDVSYIGHDTDSNAQHVARWPAGEEYLRPSLTPTTLGPRRPVRRLLQAMPCHDGVVGSRRFRAVVAAGRGDSAVITMPFDPDEAWGAKANHPVSGTIDGCRIRTRLVPADGGWVLTLAPKRLLGLGVAIGTEVTVDLAPEGPQRGDLADDIAAALAASPEAGAFFDTLAQFYRRAYLRRIDATKRRPDVRAARIAEMVDLLAAGIKERPRS